jgi:hypothetical protein
MKTENINYETGLFIDSIKDWNLVLKCEDYYKEHHKDDDAEDEFKLFLEQLFYVSRYGIYYIGDNESLSEREWARIDFKQVLEHFKPEAEEWE